MSTKVTHKECSYNSQLVARRLHISIRTLYNKVNKNGVDLPKSFIVGRRRLWDVNEFEEWFESKKLEEQLSFEFEAQNEEFDNE
jgi:predicted DNA-binding transcriptional regulator AlpA